MRMLHNLSLGVKLSLLSGIALLLIVGLGITGMQASGNAIHTGQAMVERNVVAARNVGNVRAAAGIMRAGYLQIQHPNYQSSIDGIRVEVKEQEKAIAEGLNRLEELNLTGDAQQTIMDFTVQWQKLGKTTAEMWKVYESSGIEAVPPYMLHEADLSLRLMEATLWRMNEHLEMDTTAGIAEMETFEQMARYVGIGVVVVAAILLIFLSFLIQRSLVGPVRHLTQVAAALGDGDLQVTVDTVRRKDEVGQLQNSVARMAQNMRDLLSELNRSAAAVDRATSSMQTNTDEVNQATEQLASSMQVVARNAAGQNEAVQDAARIMAEMTEAITQVAAGAQTQTLHISDTSRRAVDAGKAVEAMAFRVDNLSKGARTARTAADEGLTVVQKAVSGMSRLQERVEKGTRMVESLEHESRQIGQAVSLIQEITDQTNLLALNAAIEAARAGESGRGFAVVADEVRKLAERSGKSAGEITQLVRSIEGRTSAVAVAMQESSTEARESGQLAANAGRAFQAITDTVRATVDEIEALRHESSTVIESTRAAAASVDQVAAAIEEASATAEEMAAGSDQVSGSIRSIASSAQEMAATAQQVSAGVEELSASTTQVSETARELTQVARVLREQVSRFRI